jgi:AraC-like DNA-binding protein
MNFTLHTPPKSLHQLVKCFWTIESTPDFCPSQYYLMADGSPEIIFQYKGGFRQYARERAHMRIQHVHSKSLLMDEGFGFFGVRLYPGTVQQLMGIPAYEMSELIVCFNTMFKQPGRDLTDQLLEAEGGADRVRLFGDFLLRAAKDRKLDTMAAVAHHIDQAEGHVDLTELREQTGLSLKQFERRFKATAGFPPKQYARIARFQSTKRKYATGRWNSLTKLAYACNYYDQSHFIREFQEFSGVQASHYFAYLDKGDNESKVIKELVLPKERAGLWSRRGG